MQSIILIGNEKFSIDNVTQINHNNSINEYFVNEGRYVIEFKDGHIYYDYDESLINDYDEYELRKIPFIGLRFILMTYSSEELMKRIFLQDNFLRDIYVDDDHGSITHIDDFIKRISC